MITPKTHATACLACLLVGILLVPTGLSTVACAGAGTTAETTVAVADPDYRHSHSPVGHDHTAGADGAHCRRGLRW